MLKSIPAFVTALLAALLVVAPRYAPAEDARPLKDPGFELQLPPEQGGWTLFEDSRFSRDRARTGSKSMFNWGFSRAVAYPPYFVGNVSGSYQEFPAGPGSRWRLTGYGMTPNILRRSPAFGILQVSFFDDLGNDLGTVETADSATPPAKTSNEVNSKTPAGEWVFLDTGIATAPAGTATVQAFTLYVDFSGSDTAQGVHFDDLVLCAIGDEASADPECR